MTKCANKCLLSKLIEPRSPKALRRWVGQMLGIQMPPWGRCKGHWGPMAYLQHSFFANGRDVIVWANRGGGKTFYGAVATMLDMLYKPGIQIRILAGSLDQSRRMYGYLRSMLMRPGVREMIQGKMNRQGVELINGSRVELLAQSETAVRGQRVQKLRCDEVELFDREIWEAAQFVTQSAVCGDRLVRGSIEILSTLHRPHGLMHELIQEAQATGSRRIIQWCALDVMKECAPEADCTRCALRDACGGSIKKKSGFLLLEDALKQRNRVSEKRFNSEMLCRAPSRTDAVFPMFDEAAHVREIQADPKLMWVGGMDFGIRDPTVMLWAQIRPPGGRITDIRRATVQVIDEYAANELPLREHLKRIAARNWPAVRWVGVDPAGAQRSAVSGVSTLKMLKHVGYKVHFVRWPVVEGLDVIQRRLEGPPDEEMSPTLLIHPRCKQLIAAMTGYHFDPDRPRSDNPVKDGPDHLMDALRYLLINLENQYETRVRAAGY